MRLINFYLFMYLVSFGCTTTPTEEYNRATDISSDPKPTSTTSTSSSHPSAQLDYSYGICNLIPNPDLGSYEDLFRATTEALIHLQSADMKLVSEKDVTRSFGTNLEARKDIACAHKVLNDFRYSSDPEIVVIQDTLGFTIEKIYELRRREYIFWHQVLNNKIDPNSGDASVFFGNQYSEITTAYQTISTTIPYLAHKIKAGEKSLLISLKIRNEVLSNIRAGFGKSLKIKSPNYLVLSAQMINAFLSQKWKFHANPK